jgi:hypothetical protein
VRFFLGSVEELKAYRVLTDETDNGVTVIIGIKTDKRRDSALISEDR